MYIMISKRIARVTVATATVMLALTLFGERQPLDRYQSIIDRQMFGPLPPNFDPTKSPSEVSAKDERAKEQELTKEQEQVKSSIHFSVINVTPAGDTAVGFTDNSDSKNPKHYYLKVGESRDGWTVKEADPLAASMTIVKMTSQGEIEVSLTIGGNSVNGGTKRAGAAANALGGNGLGGRLNLLDGRLGGRSRRERKIMKEQRRAAEEKAAAEAKAKAEAAAAEKEAQDAAEKAEMRNKLAEMAEAIRRQNEASAAKEASATKKSAEESGEPDNKEGDGES